MRESVTGKDESSALSVEAELEAASSPEGSMGSAGGPTQYAVGHAVGEWDQHFEVVGRPLPSGKKISSREKARQLTSSRYLIGVVTRRCVSLARGMKDAARDGDPFLIGEIGTEFVDGLADLWAHRAARETEWAAVVNLLQTSLHGVAFERFDEGQCDDLLRLLEEHLSRGSVDDEDVRAVRRGLRSMSLDPYRMLSNE